MFVCYYAVDVVFFVFVFFCLCFFLCFCLFGLVCFLGWVFFIFLFLGGLLFVVCLLVGGGGLDFVCLCVCVFVGAPPSLYYPCPCSVACLFSEKALT